MRGLHARTCLRANGAVQLWFCFQWRSHIFWALKLYVCILYYYVKPTCSQMNVILLTCHFTAGVWGSFGLGCGFGRGGWYFGWLSLSFSICIYFRVLHKHAGLTCSSVSLTRHQTSLVSVQSFRLWRARRGKPQRKSECEFVWWADLSLLTWCIFRPLCPSPGSKRSNEKLSSCRILHR